MYNIYRSVQFSHSLMSDSVAPWTTACQTFQSITNSWSLPKLMSIESVMPSHPLSSPSPTSIFPSIRVFSNESALPIRWPKYWRFSFSISPSNELSGLISFKTDWLDLLAVWGTLKSPYITTGKTVALTRQTFVGKVMSLLLNMLSRLVINLLPRSKCLLI